MNTNTILRKSIDNQTTGNPLQSLRYKEIKVKKQPKLILYATRSNEALGLIKIQIEVKEKMFQYIWRESVYHGIFNLTLNTILCFCDHANKGTILYHMFWNQQWESLDELRLQIRFHDYEKWRKIQISY